MDEQAVCTAAVGRDEDVQCGRPAVFTVRIDVIPPLGCVRHHLCAPPGADGARDGRVGGSAAFINAAAELADASRPAPTVKVIKR